MATERDESSPDEGGAGVPPAPRLPRGLREWLMVFGPGAVIASLTIGTGELIFSTRGGALFGYRILFLFAFVSLLKFCLTLASARHMMLTGVHPYERMMELPGPRGWLPLMLLGMSVLCMPVWVSFHSGVLGNLTAWVTGTQGAVRGGVDYLWGAAILIGLLTLSALGGYTALERVQTAIVLAMVGCAAATLVLYQPDWLQMLRGLIPQPLSYPDWLAARYPGVAEHSVWVETTRYVGVIGGAGFDYLAYTSWLRQKGWGNSSRRATPDELWQIAADPGHLQRQWLRAPLIDAGISFGMVVAFSAVFVACGATVLGPRELLPDEDQMLNLQATLVTRIHAWLLPLYVAGAFLAMLGTLYGTIEIACVIADEILRSWSTEWPASRERKVRRACIAWCSAASLLILAWLFVRQAFPDQGGVAPSGQRPVVSAGSAPSGLTGANAAAEPPQSPRGADQPRILLNRLLTPVNLFTGVLFCGMVCCLNLWMDRRWMPRQLRLPPWLAGVNGLAATVFLLLGCKGYWDHSGRVEAVGCLGVMALGAVLVAAFVSRYRSPPQGGTGRAGGAAGA